MPTVQPGRVSNTAFGEQLRAWRMRRRLSQLALALEAELSTRHLSFMETGRAQPSREMVLRLSERLEVPLRERNRLLAAAGYAPATSLTSRWPWTGTGTWYRPIASCRCSCRVRTTILSIIAA